MRREPVDTVGFAHLPAQLDAVVRRIEARDGERLARMLRDRGDAASDRWRLAIAPHDDHAYATLIYRVMLCNVTAPVVLIFGVASRRRRRADRVDRRWPTTTIANTSGRGADDTRCRSACSSHGICASFVASVRSGTLPDCTTSLGEQRIDVDELDGMGVTAAATLRHWVGYVAIGYR